MDRNCSSCKYSDLSQNQKPCNECFGFDQWKADRMTIYQFIECLRDLCDQYLEDNEQY